MWRRSHDLHSPPPPRQQASNMDEDESIVTVHNTDSSVARIGFFGPEGQFLFCNTHIESFYIWHAFEVGTCLLPCCRMRTADSRSLCRMRMYSGYHVWSPASECRHPDARPTSQP